MTYTWSERYYQLLRDFSMDCAGFDKAVLELLISAVEKYPHVAANCLLCGVSDGDSSAADFFQCCDDVERMEQHGVSK